MPLSPLILSQLTLLGIAKVVHSIGLRGLHREVMTTDRGIREQPQGRGSRGMVVGQGIGSIDASM